MKFSKILLLIPLFLISDDSILSELKQKEFNVDFQKSDVESKKLKDSWINPINMSYSYTKSDQYGLDQENRSFRIIVDQPIFKSGGIYFAIKYAQANKIFSHLSIKEQKKELIATAINLLYNYNKTKLLLKKQKYMIKNSKIDVLRKKEQYLSGIIDSSFLDQAILAKNQNELKYIELKSTLEDILKNFKDISDKDPNNLKMLHFTLINRSDFLRENISIKKAKEDERVKRYFKNMTIARYLPSLSLTASYNTQEISGSFYMPPGKESFKDYGFKITMPLFDINSFRNIESTKLDYLKSKLLTQDMKRAEINRYKNVLRKLRLIDKKIELTKEDIALYEKLYEDTKEKFEAGEKTVYDIETMKNSLEARKLDIKIYQIEKQMALLELYKRVEDGKI
ncbi:TolC family protein [Nitrosophilus labii]|uniref:TolC family protein n=1 Tax=Nitrosophilus labii TaxID=2706014 RepID=UPI00165713C8|nr:TolC family protein [Nitrosophilus labii]